MVMGATEQAAEATCLYTATHTHTHTHTHTAEKRWCPQETRATLARRGTRRQTSQMSGSRSVAGCGCSLWSPAAASSAASSVSMSESWSHTTMLCVPTLWPTARRNCTLVYCTSNGQLAVVQSCNVCLIVFCGFLKVSKESEKIWMRRLNTAAHAVKHGNSQQRCSCVKCCRVPITSHDQCCSL